MYCARTWCRDLYIMGFIMYKFKVKLILVWVRAHRLSGSELCGVRSFFLIRCAVWGLVAWSLACRAENVCVSMVSMFGVIRSVSIGLKCIPMFFKPLCETSTCLTRNFFYFLFLRKNCTYSLTRWIHGCTHIPIMFATFNSPCNVTFLSCT